MYYPLTVALKEHLQHELASLRLLVPPVGKAEPQVGPPKIWIGDFPPKRGADQANRELPAVLIVPHAGNLIVPGSASLAVAMVAVIWNPEEGDGEAAENDLANLISGVQQALYPALDSVGVPLVKRYVLKADGQGRVLPWEKANSQPRPFLSATILSQWQYKHWE